MSHVVVRLDQLEIDLAKQERRWRLVTGRPDTGELDRSAFYHDILSNMFSDDDLRTICFELHVDYDNLPASSKVGKARELIVYCQNRDLIQQLYELVREKRPFLFEEEE